jgi:hypothetical protein
LLLLVHVVGEVRISFPIIVIIVVL